MAFSFLFSRWREIWMDFRLIVCTNVNWSGNWLWPAITNLMEYEHAPLCLCIHHSLEIKHSYWCRMSVDVCVFVTNFVRITFQRIIVHINWNNNQLIRITKRGWPLIWSLPNKCVHIQSTSIVHSSRCATVCMCCILFVRIRGLTIWQNARIIYIWWCCWWWYDQNEQRNGKPKR